MSWRAVAAVAGVNLVGLTAAGLSAPERVGVALALLSIASGSALLGGWWVWHHVAWPGTFPWRTLRVMVQLGLVGKAMEQPRLHRKNREGHVWRLAWTMPVGVHSGKVEAQRVALEEALDCSLRVHFDRGRLHMHMGRGQIPDYVDLREAPPARPGAVLPVVLGKDRGGWLTADVAAWPHGLVGGTTGGGKTALVQALVLQLAEAFTPDRLRLVLVDLKGGVDMAVFDHLPHLLWPIVGRHGDAAAVLSDLAQEQVRRQDQLRGRAKDVGAWNQRYPGEWLPYVLVVIDEWADLWPKEAPTKEERAEREVAWAAASALTRMGRASGIHAIIATQRPDADVLPGQIRANCPFKVALRCANEWNSYVLLGQGNAAAYRLPGRRGLAIMQADGVEERFQAVHLPADEIAEAVQEIRSRYAPRPPLEPAVQAVRTLPQGG